MKNNFKSLKLSMMYLPLILIISAACSDNTNPRVTGTTTTTLFVPPVQPPKPVYERVEVTPVPEFEPVKQSEPAPVPKAKVTKIDEGNLQGSKNPKMDILFIVDTSDSMREDQDNVSKNIDKFVSVFLKNTKMDFHIGVTSAWDSKTFGDSNRRYRNGELRPVSGSRSSQRFITRQTPNTLKVLSETLKIGTQPLTCMDGTKGKDCWGKAKDPSKTGPEHEELFSPIFAAFSDELKEGPNKGFRRDDAHLAIVIITDTGDLTPDFTMPSRTVLAETVAEKLRQFETNYTSVTVLAALARLDQYLIWKTSTNPNQTAFANSFVRTKDFVVDPDIAGPFGRPDSSKKPVGTAESQDLADLKQNLNGPEQIFQLTQLMNGEAFDLQTQEFGKKMASIGKKLIKNSVKLKIYLERPRDISETMTVKINNRILSKSETRGWSYDSEENAISISEDAVFSDGNKLNDLDNFEFAVSYTVIE
jgi:hypothetical protein